MNDLVIRNAKLVDGTGDAARHADVGVRDGRITDVGRDVVKGRREIDADGLLMTPGWVDIHTRDDGQATWDRDLTPSSWHGVTTTVFGNCGVGFAPVRRGQEGYLINLMESVEDIPGTVLAEGIDFTWESFPEYLDGLAATTRTMDVGAQVPHGALRFFVMGERGTDHAEPPTDAELRRMGELLEEGLRMGALGFTTSRTVKHRAADGRPTPSLSAHGAELAAMADALRRAGTGVLECNSDLGEGDLDILVAAARRGEQIPLEFLVKKQTFDTARTYGLLDRGVLAPGYRADFNLIDFDALNLGVPRLSYDLPAGGKRLVQKAHGYRHTFVAGMEVSADGELNGPMRCERGLFWKKYGTR